MRGSLRRLGCSLFVALLICRVSSATQFASAPVPKNQSGPPPVSDQNLIFAPPAQKRAEEAIRILLQHQAADWNRGDLDAFARGYKHSPDILFMGGTNIRRGYDQMLARYKENYPTHERMGRLTFSELEVQPLGPQFATTTGRFHLERAAAGGGNADGFFLLVLEKTTQGWKIVRDDTTALPSKPQ